MLGGVGANHHLQGTLRGLPALYSVSSTNKQQTLVHNLAGIEIYWIIYYLVSRSIFVVSLRYLQIALPLYASLPSILRSKNHPLIPSTTEFRR